MKTYRINLERLLTVLYTVFTVLLALVWVVGNVLLKALPDCTIYGLAIAWAVATFVTIATFFILPNPDK